VVGVVIPASDLPEGASHLFRYPTRSDPAILVHRPGGNLVAYSQKCTHLGCVVYWGAQEDELVCPCHEGVFDPSTGEPIAGPPDRALPRINTEVRADGMIWAIRRVEP
jgi:arsenite oxidase small subunit